MSTSEGHESMNDVIRGGARGRLTAEQTLDRDLERAQTARDEAQARVSELQARKAAQS